MKLENTAAVHDDPRLEAVWNEWSPLELKNVFSRALQNQQYDQVMLSNSDVVTAK